MTRLETFGGKIRKLFPDSISRSNSDRTAGPDVDAAVVRLVDSPRRLPKTPIEQRLVAALKDAGPLSLAALVTSVAGALYREELRKGAGVLDIGLFGSRLFHGDVIRELQAGDGVFWEIKKEREAT